MRKSRKRLVKVMACNLKTENGIKTENGMKTGNYIKTEFTSYICHKE